MSETRISLSHPAFAGRIRTYSRRSTYERRPVIRRADISAGPVRLISDVKPAPVASKPMSTAPKAISPRATAKPAPARLRRSNVLKRQIVSAPKVSKRGKRIMSLKGTLMTALASMLFVIGLGVAGMQVFTNHKVTAQVQALTTHQASPDQTTPGETEGVPSEAHTGSLSDYHVAAKAPRVLRVEKLGVEAKVVGLGIGANNQLRAPSSIFDAGWYNGSAMPGDAGAVLLDGHVHGPTMPGVFAKLKYLKVGDKLTIERGDGKVFTYRVVKSQSYAKDAVDMGAAFSSVHPGKPGLNIITCDGAYDDAGHYENRLIVFAVQE